MKPSLENAPPQSVIEVAPAPSPDQSVHPVPAADATALSLVFLLSFCVACFAWGAAILGRRERRVHKDDLPALSDTDQGTQRRQDQEDPAKARAPWEQSADWWKK